MLISFTIIINYYFINLNFMNLNKEDIDFLKSIQNEPYLLDSNILSYLCNWNNNKLEKSFEYFHELFKTLINNHEQLYITEITEWELVNQNKSIENINIKKIKNISCELKKVLPLWKENNMQGKDT